MGLSIAVLAYLGPETMLPMTSVVAGVAGVVMMFGRTSVRWLRRTLRRIAPMAGARSGASRPARRIGEGPVGGVARAGASRARVGG